MATPEQQDWSKLSRLAASLDHCFEITSQFAPNLVFFGAQAAFGNPQGSGTTPVPASFSGTGLDREKAFRSCMGEAAEFMAQIERTGDISSQRPRDELHYENPLLLGQLALDHLAPQAPLDMIQARNLTTGQDLQLPADLCLRRGVARPSANRGRPLRALSEGCAAGRSMDDGIHRALLEQIERDAAALWWIGGRDGRAITNDLLQRLGTLALLDHLRAGVTNRRTWFIDITTDIAMPVIAALSADHDGGRLACGLAARPNMGAAAQAALLECLGQEMSHQLEEIKRAQGAASQVAHAATLMSPEAASILAGEAGRILRPARELSSIPLIDETTSHHESDLVLHLARHDADVYAVDLTRQETGIFATHVFVPQLQPLTSAVRSRRLDRAIQEYGGGPGLHSGLALM
jgi:ribosomal protein S12 methylthiotransferase accessory factor